MINTIDHFLNLIHGDTYCVYWLFYLGYLFISAYLGYSNLTRHQRVSGWLQLGGAFALLLGLFFPLLTVLPIAWLLPLAVAGLFRSRDHLYYNLLYSSITPVLLLVMNRTYGII